MSSKLSLLIGATLFLAACGTDTPDDEPLDVDTNTDYSADGIDAWGSAYEERSSGKADTSGCNGVIVPDSGDFGGRVTLTFDDGPEPASTNIVLDVLKVHNIKATFFINGKRVNSQADRDALARIVAEGHILANHSHNHDNLATYGDLARVEEQVDRTHQIIEDQGVDPLYFRFPFGSSNCATADLVRSFGYRVTGWHVDAADWCFASSTGGVGYCAPSTFKWVPDSMRNDMVGLVMQQTRQKNGGILLFHDVHMNTANKLDEIINRLQQDGYTFVNLDDVSTYPLLNNDDLGDFPWTGTTCETSEECNFSETGSCLTYDNAGATAGFCTTPCEGYCDDFPGRAATFCVSVDGDVSGTCLSKAASENSNCADLPGTTPTNMPRFVGNSTARDSAAEVCLPNSLQ